MVDSMELWGRARQEVLARQKAVREAGQGILVECQRRGAVVVMSSDDLCFNGMWGNCTGVVEFCTKIGISLCAFHHERLHVVSYDVNEPQPQNPYLRPAAQVRAALTDGLLILWCRCGEPYYPSKATVDGGDGARQQFSCPNGHQMEVTAYWKELEPVAPAGEQVVATVS